MNSSLPAGRNRGDLGASREAIESHYDLGNDFYKLWLDQGMTYSSALWRGADSLEEAQQQKLDFHVAQACAARRERVLDVGCGWGSLLNRLVGQHGVTSAIGLTLSESQVRWIEETGLPGAYAVVENWLDHKPQLPYDAIISIGALEHFVRPELSSSERIHAYRTFFQSCHGWLKPDCWLSLQTIAYGNGTFSRGAISSIFPESDLPRTEELVVASDGLFEVASLENDPASYARTCREWLMRLRRNITAARALVGDEKARHFEAFLGAAARGFDARVFFLLRIRLRRLNRLKQSIVYDDGGT